MRLFLRPGSRMYIRPVWWSPELQLSGFWGACFQQLSILSLGHPNNRDQGKGEGNNSILLPALHLRSVPAIRCSLRGLALTPPPLSGAHYGEKSQMLLRLSP